MAEDSSSFLKLPPEIRILIYQHIVRTNPDRMRIPVINGAKKHSLPTIGITQVNRLIRKESIPILYRNLRISIGTCRSLRVYVTRWANKLIDNAVLASVTSYYLRPLLPCACGIRIDLTNSEHSVRYLKETTAQLDCSTVESCAAGVECVVMELDLDSSRRRVMRSNSA